MDDEKSSAESDTSQDDVAERKHLLARSSLKMDDSEACTSRITSQYKDVDVATNETLFRSYECCDCHQNPIDGPIFHCIACCDDYDLCEDCYISIRRNHDHPFYKLDKEDEYPSIMENPLDGYPYDEEGKTEINNLFKVLCKIDQFKLYLKPTDIKTHEIEQAKKGLKEVVKWSRSTNKAVKRKVRIILQLLCKVDHFNLDLNTGDINKNPAKEELSKKDKWLNMNAGPDRIQTCIKEANKQFAAILKMMKKISEPKNDKPVEISRRCDSCQMYPIKDSRYRCIACHDRRYDLCEECYRRIKNTHDHPFYLEKKDEDPSIVENPLENWPFSEEVIQKKKIDILFKFLCKMDIKFNVRDDLLPDKISENDISQASEAIGGLSELKKLFTEVKMEVQVDNINTLTKMFSEDKYDKETIRTYLKNSNTQFVSMLGKISEARIKAAFRMRKCSKERKENNDHCFCEPHGDLKTDEDPSTTIVGNISFVNPAKDFDMIYSGHDQSKLTTNTSKKYFKIRSTMKKDSLSQVIDMNWLNSAIRFPNMLISLIGDTGQMETKKEMFKNGLMNAVLLTDAVIVTNGLHAGISKLVGEAVKGVFYDPHVRKVRAIEEGRKPVLVGVTSWQSVLGNDKLISENGEARYDISSKSKSTAQEGYLDYFHNRFILVDEADGYTEQTSEFRLKFEHLFAGRNTLVVVIGGNDNTLSRLVMYWKARIPTYVVPGTGGLADKLHDIWTESKEQKLRIVNLLNGIDMGNFGHEVFNYLHEIQKKDQEKDPPVLKILDLHKSFAIETIIFETLNETKINDENYQRTCDCLINIAFGNTTLKTQSFEQMLIEGCTSDTFGERSELIEKLMKIEAVQKRINVKAFRKELGCAAFKDENIGAFSWLKNVPESEQEIYYTRELSELTEYIYPTQGSNWQELLTEFFLWSLLLNKLNLAKLICRISKDILANCCIACVLLKNLAQKTDNENLKKIYQTNEREFSSIAAKLLTEYTDFQEKDSMKARKILLSKVLTWGNHTYLDIIEKTSIDFNSMLNKQWMGDLKLETKLFKCLICIFCPILVPSMELIEKSTTNQNKKCTKNVYSLILSIRRFYKTPIIVYINHLISYLIFLQLFSYTIITEIHGHFSTLEIFLMVWVFSIFCDEIRQLFASYPSTLKAKCIRYMMDYWNRLDIVSILLFAAAVACRSLKTEENQEVARVLYACSLMTFYVRILHMFSINKKLGDILRAIAGMFQDFSWFVGIILILMISYSVASYSISYPNSEFTFNLPWKITRYGFWPMLGNFFLDETEIEEPMCSYNVTVYSTNSVPRCPTVVSRYVNPILLGVYFVISNVLLLNLIISVFSNKLEEVKQKRKQKWLKDRCLFIYAYFNSPILPPPFILLSHLKAILFQLKRKINPDTASGTTEKEFEWNQLSAYKMLSKRKDDEFKDSRKILMKDDIKQLNQTINAVRTECEKNNKEFQKKLDEILDLIKGRPPSDQ